MDPDFWTVVIANIPNFIGLIICIYLLWRVLQHEWSDDDDDDDT